MAENAYQQAIRLLSQREHSRYELATKISRKQDELTVDELNTLLDELEQSGYQDDQRFTEMFVRSSIARGHGALWVGNVK